MEENKLFVPVFCNSYFSLSRSLSLVCMKHATGLVFSYMCQQSLGQAVILDSSPPPLPYTFSPILPIPLLTASNAEVLAFTLHLFVSIHLLIPLSPSPPAPNVSHTPPDWDEM